MKQAGWCLDVDTHDGLTPGLQMNTTNRTHQQDSECFAKFMLVSLKVILNHMLCIMEIVAVRKLH